MTFWGGVTPRTKPPDISDDSFPFHVYPIVETDILMNEPVVCPIFVNSVPVHAVIDSGAAVSLMRTDFARRLNNTIHPYRGPSIKGVNGGFVVPVGTVYATVDVSTFTQKLNFLVINDYDKEILIGNNFLLNSDLVIDYSNKSVHRAPTLNSCLGM